MLIPERATHTVESAIIVTIVEVLRSSARPYNIKWLRGHYLIDGQPNWWAYLDSNQGPTGYEPVALAN